MSHLGWNKKNVSLFHWCCVSVRHCLPVHRHKMWLCNLLWSFQRIFILQERVQIRHELLFSVFFHGFYLKANYVWHFVHAWLLRGIGEEMDTLTCFDVLSLNWAIFIRVVNLSLIINCFPPHIFTLLCFEIHIKESSNYP